MNLAIEITYDCDLRCPWCVEKRHVTDGKGPINKGTVTTLLENIKSNKYEKIIFQGGEPLLYPQVITEIADAVRTFKNDTKFMLYTNATHLTKEMANVLNERQIHTVISLEAEGYKGIDNFILKHSIDPANALDNIRRLKSKNLRIVMTREAIKKNNIAENILLLLNAVSCQIEITLDLTDLAAYTNEDIQNLRRQLNRLYVKAPAALQQLELMQGSNKICTSCTKWYIIEEDTIREKCPHLTRKKTGCVHYQHNMLQNVYAEYQKLFQLLEERKNGNINKQYA